MFVGYLNFPKGIQFSWKNITGGENSLVQFYTEEIIS